MANKEKQQNELHSTIWGIATDLRGAIGGWDFKAYVLGSLFYRFISEKMVAYFNHLLKEAESNQSYADMSDEEAETRAYIAQSEDNGYVSSSGTGLAKILPAMNPFKPGRAELKTKVFEAIERLFNKYLNI